jgi:hypothetical protein
LPLLLFVLALLLLVLAFAVAVPVALWLVIPEGDLRLLVARFTSIAPTS